MQTIKEQEILIGEIVATAEMMGQAISPMTAALMASDLAEYPLNQAREALRQTRRTCKSRLTFAAIRENLLKADGRPEPSEAWALALQSQDERDSVVWTTEIATAMATARPVLEAGDKVAARMAFIQTYERLVQVARDNSEPARWELSMGWDESGRAEALSEAVRLGRIPEERAKLLGHGGHLQLEAPSNDGLAIAGLITGKPTPAAEASKRIQQLRKMLEASRDKQQARVDAEKQAQRDYEADRKREAAELVAQYAAGQ